MFTLFLSHALFSEKQTLRRQYSLIFLLRLSKYFPFPEPWFSAPAERQIKNTLEEKMKQQNQVGKQRERGMIRA